MMHSDFTVHADKSKIKSTFTQINSLYTEIYGDIADKDFYPALQSILLKVSIEVFMFNKKRL